jgi:hypothetical protein
MESNQEFKHNSIVITNELYSKHFRTQRPFKGTIVLITSGNSEVEVLKNSGNRISIQRKYLKVVG